MSKNVWIAMLAGFLAMDSARALEVVEHASLSLTDALRAAQAAMADCRAKKHAVSVAVVDAGAHLQVLLRSDNAGPHTVDSSYRKAYTALSLRRPTHELARIIAKDPEIQALHDMNDRILILGGGVPIRINGRVVGGIGVGGAPGAMLDVACARSGAKAVGGRLD